MSGNADAGGKPRLLDLFCGAGGAARGYQEAGFYVVGVDNRPQPRYVGDEFVLADAMTFPLGGFDAIHASPPCQAFSVMRSLHNAKEHQNLIPETRRRLRATGLPYVIENVPGAPLETVFMLCGSMFDLRSDRGYLRRHRYFESNVLILAPPCNHVGVAVGVYGHGSAGLGQRMRTANRDEARILMGTPTMTRDGMSQAIPPAYTRYVGERLMEHLRHA